MLPLLSARVLVKERKKKKIKGGGRELLRGYGVLPYLEGKYRK